jgi:hypothetical protein
VAVAGNRGGAGGARNIARAQRKPPALTGGFTAPGGGQPKARGPVVRRGPQPIVSRPRPAERTVQRRYYAPAPPSAAARARAQERAYASQARAVAREAYRQKPLKARRVAVKRREPEAVKIHAERERAHVWADIGENMLLSGRKPHTAMERKAVRLAVDRQVRADLRAPRARRKDRGLLGDIGHAVSEAAHVTSEAIGGAGKAAGSAVSGDYLGEIGLKAPKGGPGKFAQDVARNAPSDAAELAVTTPSSVAKLVSTAATQPEKVPGLLLEPYKELAKDPLEFVRTHPVSAALMVAPTVRLPGRVAGRVARVTGRQTLERPAAELAGTPLREARTGPRGFVAGKVSARRERGAEAPRMSEAEVRRRVDELYDFTRQRRPQVAESARTEAERRGYDEQQTSTHISGALGGDLANQFRREFGEDPPDYAVARLVKHMKVGTSKAVGARAFRVAGQSFRSTVLPASLKWLTGQAFEPGVRAALTGAGPTSWLRERRVFGELERQEPGAGVAFRQRTSGGGQFGLTGTAREFAEGKSLAEEFPESRFAGKVTQAAAAPGVRHVRRGWQGWSRFVFNGVNSTIERHARRTLAGKAIATGPLMERHLLTLSDAAIKDAASGLRETHNQVSLGRALDDMYGRYSKFSPGTRETLLHTTPFAPWYFNAANFMLRVLPRDHPVAAAVLADVSALEEQWRKEHGLSLRGGETRPGFLLGGYPTSGGGIVRYGRYTPAVPSDPAQAAADLFFPQFTAPLENLKGLDWKGQRLPGGVVRHVGEAAKSAAEAHVPGAGQVGRALERKGSARRRLRAEIDPFMATGKPPAGTARRKGYQLKAPPALRSGEALVLK